MFEVKKRGACTRTGKLSGEDWEMATPNILYPVTDRFSPPLHAEAVLKDRNIQVLKEGQSIQALDLPEYSGMPIEHGSEECGTSGVASRVRSCIIQPEAAVEGIQAVRNQTDLFILENAVELFQNPRDFVKGIVRIREVVGFQGALYIPGVAVPNNLALLIYMGVDILDSVRAALLTRQGFFLTCDGSWHTSELKGESCSCAACVGEAAEYDRLLRHNMLALHSEYVRTRVRIARGDLREFVEYRAKTSPKLVEILRHLDREFYDFQERRFPVIAKRFNATTRLALGRPDLVRFRERILTRYRKPVTPTVLVLLPCSARKPYSESKSHGFFRRAIRDSGAGLSVHELIVTSPLGLVPRELELFYPAQHYDIPVTGHWYEEEKSMINRMLNEYLKINNYQIILNHVGDPALIDAETIITAHERPTSAESLDELARKLGVLNGKTGDWKTRTLEELNSIARFQFGEKAESWLEGCNVRGRYPQLRIFKGKDQWGSLLPTTGQLIPTLHGAEFLAKNDIYAVKIHDFKLETNLFAVGVKDADPEIRTGDEVVIVRDGELVGAGTAQMPSAEMLESDRGEAVRVRHRVK